MKRDNVCPHCGKNDWNGVQTYKTINPNGEYVLGFGHAPYHVPSDIEYWCISCGWMEGGNPAIVDTNGTFMEYGDWMK